MTRNMSNACLVSLFVRAGPWAGRGGPEATLRYSFQASSGVRLAPGYLCPYLLPRCQALARDFLGLRLVSIRVTAGVTA